MNSETFQTVCRAEDIPAGEARMFPLGDLIIAVFHLDGEFFAMQNDCPHAGASLAHGYIEDRIVRCRIHHWGFAIDSGQYIDEDRPQCNARTFPVRVVEGQVQVATG